MDQEAKSIVFKGNSDGLIIVVPEGYAPEALYEEVEAKVSAAARFFKGARIKVSYRGIHLSEDEEARLKTILDEKSGAFIEALSREEEPKHPAPQAKPQTSGGIKKFFTGVDEGSCKFIRSTIRSGTRIQFEGSVVVMGDVNPGGEIVAAGNVIVLGTLRGMVHAGMDGNRDAFIYALNLKPTQIRIAELIARGSDDNDNSRITPEIATVKDGIIVVDAV